jgi:YebC/PmpR family DNA-binding regulatory protein
MAGHSQFKNIMYRKGAQDNKRAKIFTKVIREIIVAAKTGIPDPEMNPRLRSAIQSAKEVNMPRDNIERAIKKATGEDSSVNYEYVRYEGYGPSNISVIIETLTDNKNRTTPEIRAIFNKYDGSLGENGSVSFMFQHIGSIIYDGSLDYDKIFEISALNNADNVEISDGNYDISCSIDNLIGLRDILIEKFGNPIFSGIIWKPIAKNDVESTPSILKFIDVLEDNDDIQNFFLGADIK